MNNLQLIKQITNPSLNLTLTDFIGYGYKFMLLQTVHDCLERLKTYNLSTLELYLRKSPKVFLTEDPEVSLYYI